MRLVGRTSRALLLAKSELVALTRQSVRERTPASPTSTSFCWRAPDHLRYLFDRFDRGANVVGRFAGTGIGLASARELVELYGASISVESDESNGSTFVVRLPL